MGLRESDIKNFEVLRRAFEDRNIALMECKDATTGEYRAVICAVSTQPDGSVMLTPFCHLPDGNPFEMYISPLEEGEAEGGADASH